MKNSRSKAPSNQDDRYLKVDLPKSDLVLILGISSILSCFLFGIVGIVLGFIARKLSTKPIELYQLVPELYTSYSFKNARAGRTCALIGIILSSVFLVFVLVYFAIKGIVLSIF